MTTKHHALILTFDSHLEDEIHSIWRELAETGLSDTMLSYGVRPHITLGVFHEDIFDNAVSILEDLTSLPPMDIIFSSLGLFPGEDGVLFLAPKPSADLLAAHVRFFEGLGDQQALCDPLCRPETWVPHCTLAHPIGHEARARATAELPALSQNWKPLTGKVTGIEWVSFFPVEVLRSEELTG